MLPEGFWCVREEAGSFIQELAPAVRQKIPSNWDTSVGLMWSKYLKEHSKHFLYSRQKGERGDSGQEVWFYHPEAKHLFSVWLRQVYIPSKTQPIRYF